MRKHGEARPSRVMWLVAALVAVSEGVGGAGPVSAASAPEPPTFKDFALNPPRVARITAAPGLEGRALLRVEMAPDKRLGPTIVLGEGARAITLHDDGKGGDDKAGDGRYAVLVEESFASLKERQTRVVQKLTDRKVTSIPLFDGRAQTGKVAVLDFKPGTKDLSVLPPGVFGALVSKERSLFITDPGVIRDAGRTYDGCSRTGNVDGVWSFKRLMEGIANRPVTGLDPLTMAKNWEDSWQRSFGRSSSWTGGFERAPFQLVAIVNRSDLARNTAYGGAGGGELRFIFDHCQGRKTVIFEYGVATRSCAALRQWAQAWVDLGSLVPGSLAYNDALEDLTEHVVRLNAAPTRPNGSALNQMRTNAFTGRELIFEHWLLHEWHVRATGEGPRMSTTAQTPRRDFNGSADLGTWINHFASRVLAGTHLVTSFFTPFDASRPFLNEGAVMTERLFDHGGTVIGESFWRASGVLSNEARHRFSRDTCDGCHLGETHTDFAHLGAGRPLSGFLTGIDVVDPEDHVTVRHFDDLTRRAGVLGQQAAASCPTLDLLFDDLPVLLAPRFPDFDVSFIDLVSPLPPIDYTPLLAPH